MKEVNVRLEIPDDMEISDFEQLLVEKGLNGIYGQDSLKQASVSGNLPYEIIDTGIGIERPNEQETKAEPDYAFEFMGYKMSVADRVDMEGGGVDVYIDAPKEFLDKFAEIEFDEPEDGYELTGADIRIGFPSYTNNTIDDVIVSLSPVMSDGDESMSYDWQDINMMMPVESIRELAEQAGIVIHEKDEYSQDR